MMYQCQFYANLCDNINIVRMYEVYLYLFYIYFQNKTVSLQGIPMVSSTGKAAHCRGIALYMYIIYL